MIQAVVNTSSILLCNIFMLLLFCAFEVSEEVRDGSALGTLPKLRNRSFVNTRGKEEDEEGKEGRKQKVSALGVRVRSEAFRSNFK
jgi:hypothetical protein